MDFLCRSGLPESNKDDIVFKPNGTVTIKKLDDQTSKLMIEAIHGKQNFGRKLFCNGFIPLTPRKESTDVVTEATVQNDSVAGSPAAPKQQPPATSPGHASPSLTGPPTIVKSSSTGSVVTTGSEFVVSNFHFPDIPEYLNNSQLIRRHSLSVLNRTPPASSIAAEILLTPRPYMSRTQMLVSEVKDCLTDFGSCISETSDSSDSNDNKDDSDEGSVACQTMNERKRMKIEEKA